jgi:hypothetical protein
MSVQAPGGALVTPTVSNHTNGQLSADSAAAAKDQQPAGVLSPFNNSAQHGAAAADGWGKAREAVQRKVGLSQAFKTLRDMKPTDVILPEQLQTIKILGQGAFACVDKAM